MDKNPLQVTLGIAFLAETNLSIYSQVKTHWKRRSKWKHWPLPTAGLVIITPV